ncbi:MAG TPA: TolC family protein [Myxococcota bacterium]|nr:TolC family protein [Myxococcota bacterium]
MRPVASVFLVIAAFLSAAAEGAEDTQQLPIMMNPTAPGAATDIAKQVEPETPRVPLTLRDAVEKGLQNGLALDVQRYGPYIANEVLASAWGAYDPELYSDYLYSSTDTPVASLLTFPDASVLERDFTGEAGLRGILPFTSTSYGVSYGARRVQTTDPLSLLSPEIRSSIVFTVTQPLLRNLIWNQPWTTVKTSEVGSRAAWDDFRRQLMDTVQAIENAYWYLVASEEQLRVANKSFDSAKALLDQTKTQYDVGVVSKVEVTEAEAGVASREVNVITAKNAYLARQDQLIDLVYGAGLRPKLEFLVDPTDRPLVEAKYEVNLELAVEKAFSERPELAIAKDEVQRQQYLVQYAKSQRWPQVDVVGQYGYQGLTGQPSKDCVIPNFSGTFVPGQTGAPCSEFIAQLPPGSVPNSANIMDANQDFFSGRTGLNWSVKGILSVPLGNNTAYHNLERTRLEFRRANAQTKRTEQDIILDVRNAVRNLDSAYEGIEASERARIAAEEQLRAERIRLEHGESTPFDVLLREEQLVSAERDKIEALRVYQSSATALDRAQGTILESHNIVIQDVSTLR